MKSVGSASGSGLLMPRQGTPQDTKTAYPRMEPLSRYMMPHDAPKVVIGRL
jgi:hypothetical protein